MLWPSPNYHSGSWGGFATSTGYVQILLYDWPRKQRLWLWLPSDLQMSLRWQQMGVVDIPVNGQDPCQIVGKPQALRHRGSRHAAQESTHLPNNNESPAIARDPYLLRSTI
ncbi:predicted protein [Histoplasma capsulatum var. duboisii H88]|uniref:Predicted protein n=2 Tax=Ajellomyces capsulatus TaxID=5037 RepID=F0UM48_AJEC8|nr:predicted protein [Histoplasma capsulatum H143]EGC47245.1 predicted protein [Histoplasma capsulatum var. duboisii H88]QSS53417.1 hypothetical protein I7I53_00672 [Histoplasma capsulatum var. duboisii H88]